ncbi:MAG: NFACT family protein [candidate division NC10 bacterium]|nr:NFACT family protein [candidate division NC10 bacterium]
MDSLTLRAIVRELREGLIGGRVYRVYQPWGQELVLEIKKGGQKCPLMISANPRRPRLHLIPALPLDIEKAHTFRDFAKRHLAGASLVEIVQEGLERVIRLCFKKGGPFQGGELHLVAELLPGRAKLLLVEGASGRTLEVLSCGPRQKMVDAYSAPPLPSGKRDPLACSSFDEFQGIVLPALEEGKEAWDILSGAFFGLSPLMAREIALRSEGGPGPSDVMLERLWASFQEILGVSAPSLFQPTVTLGEDDAPLALSPFPLVQFPHAHQLFFPSMSQAAHDFYLRLEKVDEARRLKEEMERILTGAWKRFKRKREAIAEDLEQAQGAEGLRIKGELLKAHLSLVSRGEREVTLPNYYDPEGTALRIELDPSLSPLANAERYFKRYRKAKRGLSILRERLEGVTKELHGLEKYLQKMSEAVSLEGLRELRQGLDGLIKGKGLALPVPATRQRPRPKREGVPARLLPRRFISSEGMVILVGRDKRGNDYLTMKLADPEDLWLHAQGASGSHVVVKSPYRGREVSTVTLQEAAQLAAYYSRARQAGLVPVDYTRRKYVKKPKGVRPGVVTISREKTIFVTPNPSLVKKLSLGKATSAQPSAASHKSGRKKVFANG